MSNRARDKRRENLKKKRVHLILLKLYQVRCTLLFMPNRIPNVDRRKSLPENKTLTSLLP